METSIRRYGKLVNDSSPFVPNNVIGGCQIWRVLCRGPITCSRQLECEYQLCFWQQRATDGVQWLFLYLHRGRHQRCYRAGLADHCRHDGGRWHDYLGRGSGPPTPYLPQSYPEYDQTASRSPVTHGQKVVVWVSPNSYTNLTGGSASSIGETTTTPAGTLLEQQTQATLTWFVNNGGRLFLDAPDMPDALTDLGQIPQQFPTWTASTMFVPGATVHRPRRTGLSTPASPPAPAAPLNRPGPRYPVPRSAMVRSPGYPPRPPATRL